MSRLLYYYYLKKLITFFPTPLFLILSIYSTIFNNFPVCGVISWEMPAMWLLMALAHSRPWIEWYEVDQCPNGCGCHRD